MKTYLVVQLIGGALSSVRSFAFDAVGKSLARQYFRQVVEEILLGVCDPSELDECRDLAMAESPKRFIDGDHEVLFTVSADSTTGDVNLPIANSLDTVWSALHAFREDLIPEGDEYYDEQWDDICGAMALLREAAAGEAVLRGQMLQAGRLIVAAKEALLNVPCVGEVYDQQHSDTHQIATLALSDFITVEIPF